MATVTQTKIVTLFDDTGKTIAFAPRTKISAVSDDSGTGLQNILDAKLALAGGTMTGHITFAGGTTQATIKGLKWNSINSKNPYIGYATDQTDGTFVVSSLLGTNYASGLAIGGGSGNLLYKGHVVLHADNWSNYAAAASHSHSYLPLAGGKMTGSIKFQSSSLPSKSLVYICGIDAFDSGGEMGWQSKADFLSGYSTTDHTHPYVATNRGVDQDCGTTGYWAAMSQKHGIDTAWRHVLNMDWSGNDNKNWISQISFPTIPGQGMLYRCNGNQGKAITEYGWTTVLDSANYSSYAIPKSGGTLSSSSAQISRGGSSTSWYLGRSNAMLKISSYSGYNAITSMKTTDGDWSMGVYTGNKMYFSYVKDSDFNAGTNSTSGQIVFGPWGTMYKGGGSFGVPGVFIQSSTPSAIQAGDIWFVT